MKLKRINVTNEKVFGVCSYSKTEKKNQLWVPLLGAFIPINASDSMESGKFYYGKINFEDLSNIVMTEFVEVESLKGMRSYQYTGKTIGQEQSKYQPYDAYLVKCKHVLYDEGLRAGTQIWKDRITEAAKLYAAINNVPLHISKDTKQWY